MEDFLLQTSSCIVLNYGVIVLNFLFLHYLKRYMLPSYTTRRLVAGRVSSSYSLGKFEQTLLRAKAFPFLPRTDLSDFPALSVSGLGGYFRQTPPLPNPLTDAPLRRLRGGRGGFRRAAPGALYLLPTQRREVTETEIRCPRPALRGRVPALPPATRSFPSPPTASSFPRPQHPPASLPRTSPPPSAANHRLPQARCCRDTPVLASLVAPPPGPLPALRDLCPITSYRVVLGPRPSLPALPNSRPFPQT